MSSAAPISRPTSYLQRYHDVRDRSVQIVAPLSAEDCVVQSMPDVSPTRWHLAHTTWFFETFLLTPRGNHSPFNPAFEYLFNSYYNTVGKQFDRDSRGLLSRPSLKEVMEYRERVDQAITALIESTSFDERELVVLETGLHHEQQHQELMLTDIKHVLSCNPLNPVYLAGDESLFATSLSHDWLSYDAGITQIGHDGEGFAFDNETPRHRVFLEAFSVSNHCVTNGQFIDFIESGGYQDPRLWLSMGWSWVRAESILAPLYWQKREDIWHAFTLHGMRPIDLNAPVCHVSYFEADAYARWAGYRLPTEAEWEHARLRTVVSDDSLGVIDDWDRRVWQWTASQYTAYPGYKPTEGALGEYNGKFMCNQFVLRGGSIATSPGHTRPSYRNFFPPEARWQFTGFRLAK